MKALVGGSDDRILGFTMIGAEAGEVMAAVQTAMLADLPYSRLRDAILAHPTMAEGLGSLFSNVPPRSVRSSNFQRIGRRARSLESCESFSLNSHTGHHARDFPRWRWPT